MLTYGFAAAVGGLKALEVSGVLCLYVPATAVRRISGCAVRLRQGASRYLRALAQKSLAYRLLRLVCQVVLFRVRDSDDNLSLKSLPLMATIGRYLPIVDTRVACAVELKFH